MQLFNLFELEHPIGVMDVGAAAIAETPVYKRLLDKKIAHLIAFEGDARQTAAIKAAYGLECVTVLDHFLFDGAEHQLFLCAPDSGMTSLFRPKPEALSFFNGFETFGAVESTQTVQTERLDDLTGLGQIDFLKMDVQGAELGILENGEQTLKNCLAMQLEVSYFALYEDQPSFGEIDIYMRKAGFVPHRFMDVKRWSIAPTVFNNNIRVPGNQLLESDIVYVKDPLQVTDLTDEEVRKLSVLSHYCFQSIDSCAFALRELERRGAVPDKAHISYLQNVSQFV